MDKTCLIFVACIFTILKRGKTEELFPGSCKTTSDCTGNKICYLIPGGLDNLCMCTPGFDGEDCMIRSPATPESCPTPTEKPEICVPSGECGLTGGICPEGQECCFGPDGCKMICITPGCTNPYDLKKCTRQNKLCHDDNSSHKFKCHCALGYHGDTCEKRFPGIDERCEYPKVPQDTCKEMTDPVCSHNADCGDNKMCCSTGCGTICKDAPRKPGNGIFNSLDPSFVQLLLMSRLLKPHTPISKPHSRQVSLPFTNSGKHYLPAPQSCDSICEGEVCPNNLGAICERILGRCDFMFYDQYTGENITPICACEPNVQESQFCDARACLDGNGTPLHCANYPDAECRVSKCGQCYIYWIHGKTRKPVSCGQYTNTIILL